MKPRWILAGVGLMALVVGGGLWLGMRDSSTPLTVSDVRKDFGGTFGSTPGDVGVYRYRTVGYEEVDALAGARHDYPDETFMTIDSSACGPTVRWQALAERWTEWSHCGPELAITQTVEYHEWFGIPDEEIESCVAPRPVFVAARAVDCRTADTTETYRVELVGFENLMVDGTLVNTVHIRRTSTLSGASSGETVAEVWRLEATPLVVRFGLSGTSTTSSAIGDVHYVEELTLDLIGLNPQG